MGIISSELYPALLIDSTFHSCWVGLARSGCSLELQIAGRSGALLAKMSSDLLDEGNLSFNDLATIVVVIGPGSFTGIRTALAFCAGVELARGVIIYGVNTFQAGAALLQANPGFYVLRLPANKNEDHLLRLSVSQEGTISSDWLIATVPREGLTEELQRGSTGALSTFSLLSLDALLAGRRLEALIGAASNPALRGPAAPFYGKPVQAKTLEERGVGGGHIYALTGGVR